MNELDGTITDRAGIAQIVSQNRRLFLDARPPRAEVAVIYNPLAHFVGGRQRAAAYGGPQGEVVGIERDSLLGPSRAVLRQRPARLRAYRSPPGREAAAIQAADLPYPLMIPEAAAKTLRDYVESGGTLVAEARLAWNNEKGRASERIPGLGLAEVMGAREVETKRHLVDGPPCDGVLPTFRACRRAPPFPLAGTRRRSDPSGCGSRPGATAASAFRDSLKNASVA